MTAYLTLNYGVRHSLFTPEHDLNELLANLIRRTTTRPTLPELPTGVRSPRVGYYYLKRLLRSCSRADDSAPRLIRSREVDHHKEMLH